MRDDKDEPREPTPVEFRFDSHVHVEDGTFHAVLACPSTVSEVKVPAEARAMVPGNPSLETFARRLRDAMAQVHVQQCPACRALGWDGWIGRATKSIEVDDFPSTRLVN